MVVYEKSYLEKFGTKGIEDGLKVLQHYAWLLDCFVLDFYTEKHWEKLPSRWRSILDEVELDELGTILDYRRNDCGVRRVWPLSLLSLRSASHQLSLSRAQAQHTTTEIEGCLNKISSYTHVNCEQRENSVSLFSPMDHQTEERNKLGNEFLVNPQFSHVFMKHVKPKKRHEVALMAKITAEMAKSNDCKYIVDVGSGVGHMARTLAYGYGLNVCCLEAQDSFALQARKLDLELETTLSKYISDNSILTLCRPVHLNKILNSSVDENEFIQAVRSAFGIKNENFSFGIVGLHPCGDLGPLILQLLTRCDDAKFINIVGCCYMKLSTVDESKSWEFRGYPLSNFIAQQRHVLSYEAREIACHAIENYMDRLCKGDVSHLKVHCYRATLERILVKHWPHLRHTGIRNIKHTNKLTFEEYCFAATKRLGILVPEVEIQNEETCQDLSQWKRVVILYSLRLLLAPLVETILLWDRLFYVLELGLNGVLMPVFDPTVSPRNHILIATKKSKK